MSRFVKAMLGAVSHFPALADPDTDAPTFQAIVSTINIIMKYMFWLLHYSVELNSEVSKNQQELNLLAKNLIRLPKHPNSNRSVFRGGVDDDEKSPRNVNGKINSQIHPPNATNDNSRPYPSHLVHSQPIPSALRPKRRKSIAKISNAMDSEEEEHPVPRRRSTPRRSKPFLVSLQTSNVDPSLGELIEGNDEQCGAGSIQGSSVTEEEEPVDQASTPKRQEGVLLDKNDVLERLNQTLANRNDALQKDILALEETAEIRERELEDAKAKHFQAQQEIREIRITAHNYEQKLSEMDDAMEQIKKAENEKESLKISKQTLEAKNRQLKEVINALQGDTEYQIQYWKSEYENLAKHDKELEKQNSILEDMLSITNEQTQRSEDRIEILKLENNDLRRDSEKLRASLDVERMVDKLRQAQPNSEIEILDLQKDLGECQAELRECRRGLELATVKIGNLEHMLRTEKDQEHELLSLLETQESKIGQLTQQLELTKSKALETCPTGAMEYYTQWAIAASTKPAVVQLTSILEFCFKYGFVSIVAVGWIMSCFWVSAPSHRLGAFGMGGPDIDNWATRIIHGLMMDYGPKKILLT